jgi:hypothetical protein
MPPAHTPECCASIWAQLGAELDYLSPHDRQLAAAVPQGGSLPVASTPSQDVRRRLCVCLLRLAKDATAAMIACMPAAELLPRVRATLASRRLALDQEVSLCEALVLVANGTGSVSSQVAGYNPPSRYHPYIHTHCM